MKCVNLNHPVYKRILAIVGKPLKSEIMFDHVMSIMDNDEQYESYLKYMMDKVANDISINSPALSRNGNVYTVSVTEGSNKILTYEQAYKVAEERASKINKIYGNDKKITRITTEKGPVQIIIEPNKQHVIDFIIKDLLQEEKDKKDYNKGEYASKSNIILDNKEINIVIKKAKDFNETLKDIARNIGIDVKFVETLVNKHGMTLNGLFKVTKDLKGLIQISKDSNDDLTLSEELSHAVIDGFEQLPIVQNILRLIKTEGYQKYLGDNTSAYETMYSNNKEMLIKEAAGKALSQALYNQFIDNSESKLIKALKVLWNRVKTLFSKVTPNMENQLNDSLMELSKAVLGDTLGKAKFNNEIGLAQLNDAKPKLKQRNHIDDKLAYMKRNLGRLKAKLKTLDPDSKQYIDVKNTITIASEKISQYESTKNESRILEAAEIMIQEAKDFINEFESSNGTKRASAAEINNLINYIQSVANVPGLESEANNLIVRYNEMLKLYITKWTNESLYKGEGSQNKEYTYEELTTNQEDIGLFNKSFNTLVNLKNKVAYAIGFIIKKAQIDISSKQGDLFNELKKYTDGVAEWANDNNISTDKMYDIFIQNHKNTTILTRPYTEEFYTKMEQLWKSKDFNSLNALSYKDEITGKRVPYDKKKWSNNNYNIIMKEPRLKAFYDYYEKTIKESLERLPKNDTQNLDVFFIPNIMINTLKDTIATNGVAKGLFKYTFNINSTEVLKDDFIRDESLERDIVPLKYLKKITSDKKSNDLGESLFKFAAFSIEHEHLSEVLPKARLLQTAITNNSFISSKTPDQSVRGENSNLNEMIDRFIDMQLRGKKKTEFKKVLERPVYNDKGEIIGTKHVELADMIDAGLSWNSLLRIGLNPITAFTNVLVGEAGNIIEAAGGRFYNASELTKATSIYYSQIFDKESKMNYIIEKYPLMQELTDYEYASKLKVAKGLTGNDLKNYMYKLQKSGEVFLQSRTMIAMMLHTKPDGKTSFWEMLDDKGNIKSEYLSLFGNKEDFKEYMLRYAAKVMAVNEKIHGRYSERDAAIITQNVLWRMVFQFKKWIPAAIETRFGGYQFDERLGIDTEGRWNTFAKMMYNFKDTAKRYDAGTLTDLEKANFRKTATEIIMVLSALGLYLGLGWDDDDKRKRSALYKFTMNQLDRVSGDLLFFADPTNVTALTKNPIAMTKLADDLIGVFRNIPAALYIGEYKYKTGPRKGENKFWTKVMGVTPAVKPLSDVARMFKDDKYRDYTQ